MKAKPDKLLDACEQALARAAVKPSLRLLVPGRVELLGKHTDYAGGRSVVLATNRGFRAAAAPRSDRIVRMIPADKPGPAESFPLGQTPEQPGGHWVHYPATAARRLAANFDAVSPLRGADIAFASDLPPAAGMSSGSAFLVATALALTSLNDLELTEPWRRNVRNREDLAMYLACAENGQSFGELPGQAGVGTFGGSEDHTAILCCQADKLSVYRYAPTRFEQSIDWPADLVLAVAVCGVQAEKTGTRRDDYNLAAQRARQVVDIYNKTYHTHYAHLGQLLDDDAETPEDLQAFFDGLSKTDPSLESADLGGRFGQFWQEDRVIIPQALEAFARADWETFGRLCDQSHRLADECLANQIAQTNALQRLARFHGALGASAFGAGFGGSVWALVPTDEADGFVCAWRQGYRAEFPDEATRAEFLLTRPADSARIA